VASYRIEWKRSATKELQLLSPDLIRRVLIIVEQLAINPLPHGSIKLTGSDQTYRIRVGDYRVIYSLYQNLLLVEIIRIAHRRDVYR
jgi:mRNA interferase RelE/StbE